MAALYLLRIARFSSLVAMSVCIFAGHLPTSHADETRGDKPSLADWQVLGLLDAVHDTDLDVRTRALLKLTSENSIPNEIRSSDDALRTIRDLLDSPLSSNVKSGLTLSLLSGESVKQNQVRIRELLNKPSVDSDITLLSAKALSSTNLLTSEDVPALSKVLHSSVISQVSEAIQLLHDAHLLTAEHGRIVAASMKHVGQREYSKIIDILAPLGMVKDEDVLYLEQQSQLIDPRGDPYRFLDIAKAIARSGKSSPAVISSLEQFLKPAPGGTIDVALAFAAIQVLNGFGPSASPVFQRLADTFSLQDINTTMQNAFLLSQSPSGSKLGIPFFDRLSNSEDAISVYVALIGLNELHGLREEHRPRAMALLQSENAKMVLTAATVLKVLKTQPSVYHDRVIDRMFSTDDEGVLLGLLSVLSDSHALNDADAPVLLRLFEKQDKADSAIYISNAICQIGPAPPAVISRLDNLLTSDSAAAAAFALKKCNAATSSQAEVLSGRIEHLSNTDSRILVLALGNMGPTAASTGVVLARGLALDNSSDSLATLVAQATGTALDADRSKALEQTGPHNVATLSVLFSQASMNPNARAELLALAYELAGHKEPSLSLVSTLRGSPTQLSKKQQLDVLLNSWDSTADSDGPFRDQLAHTASSIVRNSPFYDFDEPLLENWVNRLKSSHHEDEADEFERVIERNSFRKYAIKTIIGMSDILAVHILLWATLLGFYKRSKVVRAVFFWNPFVRRFLGFGYVGFLLTYVPSLRSLLLAPFNGALLASAGTEDQDLDMYFDKRQVVKGNEQQSLILEAAIPSITGHVILEGDSGFGKSMFARRLVKTSRKPTVFLRASDCSKGPNAAIREKLHGLAEDEKFLNQLIYIGALDICIDGLNEAPPDTRSKIGALLEGFESSNILITTQPIDLKYGGITEVFTLQPLAEDEIRAFILRRMGIAESGASDNSALAEGELKDPQVQRVDEYLAMSLSPELLPEQRKAALDVLSNPFDLSIVADMLKRSIQPKLYGLIEQEFQLADDEYRRTHSKSEFPIDAFIEAVYQSRINPSDSSVQTEFGDEIESLREYRLVIVYRSDSGDKYWTFRHERIRDYFVAKAMLKKPERLEGDLDNMRLRGAYAVLATELPDSEAQWLKDKLVSYAVQNNDIATLRDFVKGLSSKEAAATRGEASPAW